jgi:hypothetical protein
LVHAGDKQDLAAIASMFREIKAVAVLNFRNKKFMHCHRVCNQAAHTLVNHSVKLNQNEYIFWPVDGPDFVQYIVSMLDTQFNGISFPFFLNEIKYKSNLGVCKCTRKLISHCPYPLTSLVQK